MKSRVALAGPRWRIGAYLLAAVTMSVAAHAAPPGERPAAGGSSARGLIVLRRTTPAGDTLTLRQPLHLFPQLQQPGSGSNINLNQVGGASVSSSLYDSGNTALKVNCVVGCSATSGFTDNSAFTAGTTSVNNISGVFNDSIAALTTGNAGALRATSDRMLFVNLGKIAGTVPTLTGSSLNVNCTGGCGGPATFADNSAFTAGTTSITNIGAVFNDGLAAVTSGNAAAPRITSQRGLHVNLRNSSGTEIATSANPLRIDPTGTTTQPVSGTVTANAGTGTFTVGGTVTANIGTTNGLALDSSVNGILNAQASATSGEKGPLAQCAVTTSAPSYTTAQTDPLSCNTSGGLRVDGSGVTQPVSGTVTANAGTGTFNIQANASVNLAQVAGTTTSTSNGTSNAGDLRINVASDNSAIANWGQGATGSAVPSGAVYHGGNGSGNLTGITVCDHWTAINLASTTATTIITGVASKQTYICSINLVAGAAVNVALIEGTTSTCGTGTAGMAGGTTAATGWNFAANGGLTEGSGIGAIFRTATAADNVCLLASATSQLSGNVSWTQY